jgi:hypothetical protein
MPVEMLERLRLDPGSRTVGELFQERQWAVQEIERLRDLGSREASTSARCVAAARAHKMDRPAALEALQRFNC